MHVYNNLKRDKITSEIVSTNHSHKGVNIIHSENIMIRAINLGCGMNKRKDALNVDIIPEVRPDIVLDLNQYPWPFKDEAFDAIYAHDVVEHLRDVVRFMEECWRILRPDGLLEITTPHFSCANSYTDPTHIHHFGYFSFDYFTFDSKYSFYSKARFRIERKIIAFHGSWLNAIIGRIANRYPEFYERRLCWIFPAWFLLFHLRAVKDNRV